MLLGRQLIYISLEKLLLMMKVIRWYAHKNKKSGVFNKDGMVEIRTKIYKLSENMRQLADKAK